MAKISENRQCLVCGQLIPPEQDGVIVRLHPENRMVHHGCACKVKDALEKFDHIKDTSGAGNNEIKSL